MNKSGYLGFLLFLSISSITALAAESPKRQKVIDFEDDVVEGLNKRPFDSLNQISEANKRRKRPHLYRKRASFKTEVQETLRTLRFVP